MVQLSEPLSVTVPDVLVTTPPELTSILILYVNKSTEHVAAVDTVIVGKALIVTDAVLLFGQVPAVV